MRTADMSASSKVRGISVEPARIAGVLELTLPAFRDGRGFFKETFVRSKYLATGISEEFVQDSMSFSAEGVLRGLHADPK